MRLHALAITAFGPFAGSEKVDLDALASSGLFLIHGPTGAGKTSILDAICFALYAAVPGARAGARASLRSDHAAQGVVPEVTLEFTAAGRRLRVRRSPEFTRPKKRGTGKTTVPARVVLDELLEAGWRNLGTRNDEVAMMLKDILGMGLEQFIKVVLLPQGDFAAFLRASPEERRLVLEKLFDTQRFTDIETWLAERRRQTTTAVGAARDTLATGLLRVDDVIARLDEGDDLVTGAWADLLAPKIGTGRDVNAVLHTLAEAVEQRATRALAGVEVARTAAVQAESAVHGAAVVLRHQETAADAQARLDVLDQQRGSYQDAARRVDLSKRAAAVSGFLAAARSANLRRDDGLVHVVSLREPVALILERGGHDGADASAVDLLVEQLAGNGAALQQVIAHDAQARRLAEDSARHRQAATAADTQSVAFALQRSEAEAKRAAAETSRDGGRAALGEIPALQARQKTLTRIRQLLDEQSRSTGNLERLRREADSAQMVLAGRRKLLLDLREHRLVGLAAELATGLQSGGPCPVCGSCIHPAPAASIELVTALDLESAEAEVARADEDLSLITSSIAAEVASADVRAVELEAHHSQPGHEPMTVPDVDKGMTAAAATIAQALLAAAALPQAQSQLTALGHDLELLEGLREGALTARAASLALADTSLVQSRRAEAEATELLASHRAACPCHAGELTDIAGVISRHAASLDHLRLLAGGLSELATHTGNARDADLRLSTALQANGLESIEQAAAAVLPPERVAELTAALRTAEQHTAQATALLAQPDVSAALALPTPDVAALAQAHKQASELLTEAHRRHTFSEQAQRELRGLSHIIYQGLADLGPAQEEAELVQELADCFAGNSADNSLRMRLSSYVLATRLGEIATLANERLTTMSDGRYTLEYSDARAARGARSGLGLLVRDAWTGQTRQTSSLSGGEAFMASLALALGMGDAVRAEAGGLDLQTLFVDEGFGSLDEESLEQVMAVLDTLRQGGRAVGIVSHVTELRTRIPDQLQVLKHQGGSSIRTENRASPAA
jgi:DNA repair protein SbcC/Rad50